MYCCCCRAALQVSFGDSVGKVVFPKPQHIHNLEKYLHKMKRSSRTRINRQESTDEIYVLVELRLFGAIRLMLRCVICDDIKLNERAYELMCQIFYTIICG